jgi:hypothetical protein
MSDRNPDLPILDELGADFEALATAACAAEEHGKSRGRAPLPVSRRSRARRAQARRIGRRAAVMLLLLCLVGGVAFAALRGGDSGVRGHTSPALLGRDPGGAWTFSAYLDEGRLCTVFAPRSGELSGNCGAAPGHGRLRAGSALAAGHRYVFGVAGPGVDRESGALRGAVGVRHPVDPIAAADAGLRAGEGWFVFDLGPVGRDTAATSPAVVVPLTKHGAHAGPPYVDCSLGVLDAACERRIKSAARG